MVIENLPFDKYELEPSPLTLFILGRKQPNFCWQVFIQGSTKNGDTGHPFGYLKVSSDDMVANNVGLTDTDEIQDNMTEYFNDIRIWFKYNNIVLVP